MPLTRIPTPLAFLGLVFLLAPPAGGDWLVTLQGELIETRGPWTVDGDAVTYTDPTGVARTLPVEQVDLEGSRETTAQLTGRRYEPVDEASEPAPEAAPGPAADDEPRITLYMTSWCGYCRKARQLLNELDADFVAKDIEKDPDARREFSVKGGGRGGVPLIDFDGQIVRGYSDRTIRQQVRQLRKKYGDA